ncbi:hypothetical protein C8R47DRAFT_1079633 [Mycena vitilis]|nr:hypothetical protein C8R47DRAFT_1079633 [Mycena vitilis]
MVFGFPVRLGPGPYIYCSFFAHRSFDIRNLSLSLLVNAPESHPSQDIDSAPPCPGFASKQQLGISGERCGVVTAGGVGNLKRGPGLIDPGRRGAGRAATYEASCIPNEAHPLPRPVPCAFSPSSTPAPAHTSVGGEPGSESGSRIPTPLDAPCRHSPTSFVHRVHPHERDVSDSVSPSPSPPRARGTPQTRDPTPRSREDSPSLRRPAQSLTIVSASSSSSSSSSPSPSAALSARTSDSARSGGGGTRMGRSARGRSCLHGDGRRDSVKPGGVSASVEVAVNERRVDERVEAVEWVREEVDGQVEEGRTDDEATVCKSQAREVVLVHIRPTADGVVFTAKMRDARSWELRRLAA